MNKRIRQLGDIEGISYLVLVFIAMPLKYGFDLPKAVTYTGMVHGSLFVLFCLSLAVGLFGRSLSFFEAVKGFVLAFIPFGTFWWGKKLQ